MARLPAWSVGYRLLLLGSGLLAATACAAEPLVAPDRLYVGLRGGGTLARDDSSKIDNILHQRGYAVQTQVQDSAGMYGGYMGYWLVPRIAVEWGIEELGRYDVRVSGAQASKVSRIASDLKSLKPFGGRAEYAQARFEVAVRPDFSFSSGLGLFFSHDSGTQLSPSGSISLSKNHFGGVAGIDGSYRLWRGLHLRAGWQAYGTTNFNVLHVFHGGLEYRFGQ